MQAVSEAVEPIGGCDGADAGMQVDVAGCALTEFVQDVVDLAADGGIAGQYGGMVLAAYPSWVLMLSPSEGSWMPAVV